MDTFNGVFGGGLLVISFSASGILTFRVAQNITKSGNYLATRGRSLNHQQRLRVCVVASNGLLQISYLAFYIEALRGRHADLNEDIKSTILHFVRNVSLSLLVLFFLLVTLERYLSITRVPKKSLKYKLLIGLAVCVVTMGALATALTCLSNVTFNALWTLGSNLAALMAVVNTACNFAFNFGKLKP
jgi:hypothetical protein